MSKLKSWPAAWSFNLDVPRASADTKCRATAIDCSCDMVAIETALHGHGLSDADIAGASVGVQVEVRVADAEMNGSAAGGELPVAGRLAFGLNISGASAGFESASETVEPDVAAAGLSFYIARTNLLKFDVARACAEGCGTLDAVNSDVA